jgi:putative transposase
MNSVNETALVITGRALEWLKALGAELERSHPGAAASLREGIDETLMLTRLGVTGSLKRTVASTNPCESMIECVRRTSRNVKRWSSGEMALRWTAAGMLEAERQFRRVIAYRGDLAKLCVAIERDISGGTTTASNVAVSAFALP